MAPCCDQTQEEAEEVPSGVFEPLLEGGAIALEASPSQIMEAPVHPPHPLVLVGEPLV